MQATDFLELNLGVSRDAASRVVSVADYAIGFTAQPKILQELLYTVEHLDSQRRPEISLTVIRRTEIRGELPRFGARRAVTTQSLEYEYLGELDAIGLRDGTGRALLILGNDAPPLARPEAMRILIDWLLSGKPIVALHGATVSWGQKTALISNRGGSGKSSTTAACVVAGAKTCGDDFLLGDSEFRVHSVSRSVKLAESSPAKALYQGVTPGVRASFVSAPGEEKDLFLLDELMPGSMTSIAKPDVLLVPKISDGWRLAPIEPLEVLQAVAPNSVAMNRDRIAAIAYVKELVARLPAYALEVGPDLVAGAEFLRRELSR